MFFLLFRWLAWMDLEQSKDNKICLVVLCFNMALLYFYQDDFICPESYKRAQPIRPPETDLNLGHGDTFSPFSTHYKQEYVHWKNMERPKSFKKLTMYTPPTDKFAQESIMKAHYKGEGK